MTALNHLLNLPTPSKMKYFWKFGSLLGFILVTQMVSGVLLCFNYTALSSYSFFSVNLLSRDVLGGDMVRNMHAKGASLFFLFLYLHMGRGIYYKSYYHKLYSWLMGLTMLLFSMAIAFLGYVLPWGQMSYWGATVMTNLFSVVPIVGKMLVEWVWGGFSVNSSTLTRFLGLHIILPLVLVMFVGLHILLLHKTGSSNPVGMSGQYQVFYPYWVVKDVLGMLVSLLFLLSVVLLYPYLFMDPENFLEANYLVTPAHMQPEWYFLAGYAVLRSVPNKMGGVIGLLMVFIIFYFKPFFGSFGFCPNVKMMFWFWVSVVLGLTWMGGCVVEFPFIEMGRVLTFFYFYMMVVFL